eukprot:CAMPEP_0116125692 /NCGR_PEP_ID=MMETSP0329-20121206/5944_1 /TAXON_ID=697910 /ORGANISM="Pseudo-nitzschia arenysensis, Strain B593" /LENGTH=116 /DNA_ID=CAMNT_0003619745 /DNA_START=77 /DNA_END=427 /DNA_ORIENTATION=+
MSTLLPQDPLNVNTVEYDFEEYALEHGIPETLDPLPYRKAGSVFSNTNDDDPNSNPNDENGANSDQQRANLTSAKHDPRLRTVVCRQRFVHEGQRLRIFAPIRPLKDASLSTWGTL